MNDSDRVSYFVLDQWSLSLRIFRADCSSGVRLFLFTGWQSKSYEIKDDDEGWEDGLVCEPAFFF